MTPPPSIRVDSQRLLAAYTAVQQDLLAERELSGHWIGQLSSSALSTATAVSALAVVERHDPIAADGCYADERRETRLSELIVAGLRWLAERQNEDGGWGDTDGSRSNIATTILVTAAFHLTGVPADHAEVLEQADLYIERQGGTAGLRRRYGRDKTFAVPIMTNAALAGIVPWHKVSPLPFELSCLPQWLYRYLRLPVVSYAIPALVGVGQARFFHRPPLNPVTRFIRGLAVERSLRVVQEMQPDGGGFLEAAPLTSFVVMSLASTGRIDHPIVRLGTQFLVSSVRPDGSWPIDTNLATWNTSLCIQSLSSDPFGQSRDWLGDDCLDWLLSCQHRQAHPFTGAAPGGWAWTDASGGVPDADDTAGALLALDNWRDIDDDDRTRIRQAVRMGMDWLLNLQNSDGGWPTFCRGWGKLPFDRSGVDLTAHVLRALVRWRTLADPQRVDTAVERGFSFLHRQQKPSGSWVPLWFGNQSDPNEENPVYGTAKVLIAYQDLGRLDSEPARRAFDWLKAHQNEDGGWGGENVPSDRGIKSYKRNDSGRAAAASQDSANVGTACQSSVEETALALEALLAEAHNPSMQHTIHKGLDWLIEAVERQRYKVCSPIGFYFAKLWYHEELYPLIFTASALGRAVRTLYPDVQVSENCDAGRKLLESET